VSKDGDFYDRCPEDGCLEVDYVARNEGDGSQGHEHEGGRETAHEWSIYSADRRQGGCGAAWTRTNATGVQRYNAMGRTPVGLTAAAEAERSYFLPTDAYRDQYERIFGHA
jgi:hypothetical protein